MEPWPYRACACRAVKSIGSRSVGDVESYKTSHTAVHDTASRNLGVKEGLRGDGRS